jgi:hypothetical protein
MFGFLKMRRQLARLEAELEDTKRQQEVLINSVASVLEEKVRSIGTSELLKYFQTELDPKVRKWAYNAVEEAARLKNKCEHDIGDKILMRVSMFRANVSLTKSGGLIETDADGHVKIANTYYGTWSQNKQNYISIYLRKCRRCGAMGGVDASDVAMVGKNIVDRSIMTIDDIRGNEPVLYLSQEPPVRDEDALDDLLQTK